MKCAGGDTKLSLSLPQMRTICLEVAFYQLAKHAKHMSHQNCREASSQGQAQGGNWCGNGLVPELT